MNEVKLFEIAKELGLLRRLLVLGAPERAKQAQEYAQTEEHWRKERERFETQRIERLKVPQSQPRPSRPRQPAATIGQTIGQ